MNEKSEQDRRTAVTEGQARHDRMKREASLNGNPEYDALLARTLKAEAEVAALKGEVARLQSSVDGWEEDCSTAIINMEDARARTAEGLEREGVLRGQVAAMRSWIAKQTGDVFRISPSSSTLDEIRGILDATEEECAAHDAEVQRKAKAEGRREVCGKVNEMIEAHQHDFCEHSDNPCECGWCRLAEAWENLPIGDMTPLDPEAAPPEEDHHDNDTGVERVSSVAAWLTQKHKVSGSDVYAAMELLRMNPALRIEEDHR